MQERIKNLIKVVVDEGATLLLDGRAYKPPKHPNDVKQHMECYKELGPLTLFWCVWKLTTQSNLINENEYGSGVAIFTNRRQVPEGDPIGINVCFRLYMTIVNFLSSLYLFPCFLFTGNKKFHCRWWRQLLLRQEWPKLLLHPAQSSNHLVTKQLPSICLLTART